MSVPTTPGSYLYTDAMPDAQPQLVQVVHDGTELVAAFGDADDGETLIAVAEMSGEFQPA